MSGFDSAKAHLEERRAELEQRLAHLTGTLARPLDADFEEMAVEVEDDASIEAQVGLVTSELASIDRALERLADGTYGACVRCGEDITPERLEARPEAALCIRCANAAT